MHFMARVGDNQRYSIGRPQVLRAQVAAPGQKVVAGPFHGHQGGLVLRVTPQAVSQRPHLTSRIEFDAYFASTRSIAAALTPAAAMETIMLAGNSARSSPLTQNLRHIEIGDVKLRQLAVASLNSMEEDEANV